jgi:hypothetical protein
MQENDASAETTSTTKNLRAALCALVVLVGLSSPVYATQSAALFSPSAVASMSPAAEVVQPFQALSLAKQYTAAHPGTDFLVGSGDSMLPLYRDHTVVVTARTSLAQLKAGMTVVYIGGTGRPVAHVLVSKSARGWIAMGVGNAKCDATPVTEANLVGVVVKAYTPTKSPMVALLNEAHFRLAVASMP